MIKYALCKIKKGKRQVWIDWCKELMERKDEATQTIIEEQLIRERCIIFGQGDDSYVFYEHQTVEGKEKLPFNPLKEINITHDKKLKECLEFISKGGDGYDLIA